MSKTSIEWTDEVWNPVRGCSRVSEGCRNCYAERMASRFSGPGRPYEGLAVVDARAPHWTGRVDLVGEHLEDPLRWKRPRRIFVNSMSDLFHEALDFEAIAAVFGVMAASPRHTFQVLTKRPARMREWFRWVGEQLPSAHPLGAARGVRWYALDRGVEDAAPIYPSGDLPNWRWPLPNVWLGVSVDDQATADARIPELLQTPAAVRFVSAEPLLGHVDLGLNSATCSCCARWTSRWIRLHRPVFSDVPFVRAGLAAVSVEPGIYRAHSNQHGALSVETGEGRLGVKPAEFDALPRLDWVITGGESGPGARPMHPAWARSIRDQCIEARTPFFFKQWGEWWHGSGDRDAWHHRELELQHACVKMYSWPDGAVGYRTGKKTAGRDLDGRTWDEFPAVATQVAAGGAA